MPFATTPCSLRHWESSSGFHHRILRFVIFLQVDVAALCASIRDWTIAQIPGGAAALDQLVCGGKPLLGVIVHYVGGGSAFFAQVKLYLAALGVAYF